jgi:FAD/FMN-containing dehydrogenase
MASASRLSPLPSGIPPIVQPDDPGYDQARQAWNLVADLRPDGVAVARSVEQLQGLIAYAQQNDRRIAVMATGHRATALPALDGTLLVQPELHDGTVSVDPRTRIARVQAGAVAEDVAVAAAEHGLAVAHGSSPNIGIIGYLLGGGLSSYGRRCGMAANLVRAIEVVVADGRHLRVDAQQHPDLLWALRGGGGSLGIVTAVEIELLPIERVFAGMTMWPMTAADEVVRAWTAWARSAPEEVTTSLRLVKMPPLPQVPEPLRGKSLVMLDGAFIGEAADGEAVLAPLRGLGQAMTDTWAQVSPLSVLRVHNDPEDPVPGVADHALIDNVDDRALDTLIAAATSGLESALAVVELRQLGGAVGRAPVDGGAVASLPGEAMMLAAGGAMKPGDVAAINAAAREATTAMAPWSTGRLFGSFDEHGVSAEALMGPEDYARLVRVRDEWDPQRRFVASNRIG